MKLDLRNLSFLLLLSSSLLLTSCNKRRVIATPVFSYAKSCEEQGEFEKAQKAYGFCTSLDPEFIEAYAYRSVALVHLHRFSEAFKTIEKAYQLDSTHATVLNCYGIYYSHQDNLPRAKHFFNKAIFYSANPYNAYSNLGIIAVREEKYDSALYFYDHAINGSQSFFGGYLNRGSVYEMLKNNEKAISDYTKALSLCESGKSKLTTLMYRGNLYRRIGRFDSAIKDYDEMLTMQHPPDARWTYYYRGMAYVGKENYKKAMIDFRMAKTLGKSGVDKVIEEVERMMEPVN